MIPNLLYNRVVLVGLLCAIIFGSCTVGFFIGQKSVLKTRIIDVSLNPSQTTLAEGESEVFTTRIHNGSAPFSVSWFVNDNYASSGEDTYNFTYSEGHAANKVEVRVVDANGDVGTDIALIFGLSVSSYSYIIFKDDIRVFARDGLRGNVSSSTDAASIFQLCLDGVEGTREGRIFVLNGIYSLESGLVMDGMANFSLQGETKYGVILQTNNSITMLTINGTGTKPGLDMISHPIVTTLTLDGRDVATIGINLKYCWGAELQDVIVKHCHQDLKVETVFWGSFINCEFWNGGDSTHAMVETTSATSETYNNNIMFLKCYFRYGTTQIRIDHGDCDFVECGFESEYPSYSTKIGEIVASECCFDGCFFGNMFPSSGPLLKLTGHYNTLQKCRFQNNTAVTNVEIAGAYCDILDSRFDGQNTETAVNFSANSYLGIINDRFTNYSIGVARTGTAEVVRVYENVFRNVIKPVTGLNTIYTYIKDNEGFKSEAVGEATIQKGRSSVDINPGLHHTFDFTSYRPYVVVTGQSSEVRDLIWFVKNATTITVRASRVTTADRRISYLISAPMIGS